MSKKTLNKANLQKLGAEKLAELIIDLVQGSAAHQLPDRESVRTAIEAANGDEEAIVRAIALSELNGLEEHLTYKEACKARAAT
jgi:hypothetical protein